jgi:hypothetical protein
MIPLVNSLPEALLSSGRVLCQALLAPPQPIQHIARHLLDQRIVI